MSRLRYRVGHFAGRRPWRVVAEWILIAVTAFMLNSSIGGTANDTFRLPGAESQAAADALEDRPAWAHHQRGRQHGFHDARLRQRQDRRG